MENITQAGAPNFDAATGIHFGVIHQNNILGEKLEWLEDHATNVSFENYKREIKEQLTATWASIFRIHARGMSEEEWSNDLENIVDQAFDDFIAPGWEASGDCSDLFLSLDGLIITRNDRGYIMVIKSPFFTYAAYCSPCYPNAGDLGTLRSRQDGIQTYCLPPGWYEKVAVCEMYNVSDLPRHTVPNI